MYTQMKLIRSPNSPYQALAINGILVLSADTRTTDIVSTMALAMATAFKQPAEPAELDYCGEPDWGALFITLQAENVLVAPASTDNRYQSLELQISLMNKAIDALLPIAHNMRRVDEKTVKPFMRDECSRAIHYAAIARSASEMLQIRFIDSDSSETKYLSVLKTAVFHNGNYDYARLEAEVSRRYPYFRQILGVGAEPQAEF
ncbi:hypothetical protein EDF88_4544 [Buttiauxella sp. BIGb0552]|uniref:hypothetical protein n=1 Tax=Buttiauxella sp. BIGb0552 TaxID=2485120 RepID=UPI001064946C|nr:hypothetical protein [Buttiauxella sp. BIGb0552]TDX11946.1 hypothetical protein EDF88_4544 [Buttiauxella sp. BIGb0552]